MDAIVNAANSGMTGCYRPNHNCIDNCIHTYSGVQLRQICGEIMEKQGYEEPTGQAKITPAYNLPCKYVIHTVGPIINEALREKDCQMLESCYRSCLELAEDSHLECIAFCCNANPNADYICINLSEAYIPAEIEKQSICIAGDIGEILSTVL